MVRVAVRILDSRREFKKASKYMSIYRDDEERRSPFQTTTDSHQLEQIQEKLDDLKERYSDGVINLSEYHYQLSLLIGTQFE